MTAILEKQTSYTASWSCRNLTVGECRPFAIRAATGDCVCPCHASVPRKKANSGPSWRRMISLICWRRRNDELDVSSRLSGVYCRILWSRAPLVKANDGVKTFFADRHLPRDRCHDTWDEPRHWRLAWDKIVTLLKCVWSVRCILICSTTRTTDQLGTSYKTRLWDGMHNGDNVHDNNCSGSTLSVVSHNMHDFNQGVSMLKKLRN